MQHTFCCPPQSGEDKLCFSSYLGVKFGRKGEQEKKIKRKRKTYLKKNNFLTKKVENGRWRAMIADLLNTGDDDERRLLGINVQPLRIWRWCIGDEVMKLAFGLFYILMKLFLICSETSRVDKYFSLKLLAFHPTVRCHSEQWQTNSPVCWILFGGIAIILQHTYLSLQNKY